MLRFSQFQRGPAEGDDGAAFDEGNHELNIG